ncbi:MAG TPA: hypothetical protein V6C81_07630 [Planktothrix sp.]|jgi:hypothetical protein
MGLEAFAELLSTAARAPEAEPLVVDMKEAAALARTATTRLNFTDGLFVSRVELGGQKTTGIFQGDTFIGRFSKGSHGPSLEFAAPNGPTLRIGKGETTLFSGDARITSKSVLLGSSERLVAKFPGQTIATRIGDTAATFSPVTVNDITISPMEARFPGGRLQLQKPQFRAGVLGDTSGEFLGGTFSKNPEPGLNFNNTRFTVRGVEEYGNRMSWDWISTHLDKTTNHFDQWLAGWQSRMPQA